uniref:F-box domain-containing protein n=1 Tax=Mantoniella antarctica TaxID=81844 RepID=A0A7S0SA47_9CHLO|mmetsp:Transcript_14362/g.35029  ORF Transcript_14362/g.35029 Transcript_14362/m.35029 type:complete len:837 (+) Transcript_14362:178-2688(+)
MVLGGSLLRLLATFFVPKLEAARAQLQLAALRLRQHSRPPRRGSGPSEGEGEGEGDGGGEGEYRVSVFHRHHALPLQSPVLPGRDGEDVNMAHRGGNADSAMGGALTLVQDVTAAANASSASSTRSASAGDGIDRDIPWGDLPEECVERILLGAGFRSALSATAACQGWKRVATSQNFWRKMFVVHFGRRETSVESARMRRRINAATARLAASNSTVGLCKAGTADDTAGITSAAAAAVVVVAAWDWRGAFKEAVCTEWRWMGGRCMRTNDWVGHSDRVVRVALYNGRAITAALDGSVRIWDVKSGENIAVFRRRKFEFSSSDIERQRGRRRDAGSDSYRRDDSGEETDGDAETDSGVGNDIGQAAGPTGDEVSGREAVGGVEAISDDAINGVEVVSSGEEDHHNPDDAEVMPVLCLAVDDTGLAVAGMSDGTVTVYDVAVGQRLHCSRVGTEPVVSVAVGAGWLVAGLSNGGVEVRAARDGSRFLRLKSASRTFHFPRSPSSTRVLEAAEAPQHADIVRCLEIDARSGLAAAASGMYVAVWALGRDDNISIAAASSSPRHVWLKGHTEPVRALCFAALSPVHHNISTTALVTGGDDATIRVWDAQSGRCLRELEGPPGTTEAEHAGQVPVGWTYRPPPGITCVSVWANQVVEGRDDGSVLVWTGVFEGLEEDAEAAAAAAAAAARIATRDLHGGSARELHCPSRSPASSATPAAASSNSSCAAVSAPPSFSSASRRSSRHRSTLAPALEIFFTIERRAACVDIAASRAFSSASARATWLASDPLACATASSSTARRRSNSPLCVRASARSRATLSTPPAPTPAPPLAVDTPAPPA